MSEFNLMCAGCENNECDDFTLFNGTLLCGYCLDDYLKNEKYSSFMIWLILRREEMEKDRNKLEAGDELNGN